MTHEQEAATLSRLKRDIEVNIRVFSKMLRDNKKKAHLLRSYGYKLSDDDRANLQYYEKLVDIYDRLTDEMQELYEKAFKTFYDPEVEA